MKSFELDKIKRIIAEKYNWGPSEKWTNFHFRELAKLLEKITGDRISEDTLKRIFGKRKVSSESYQPQAFSQMVLIKLTEYIESTGPEKKVEKLSQKNRYRIPGLVLAGIIVIFALIILLKPFNSITTPDFSFICENPNDYFPFTATFRYDISEISDSVFTDFGRNEETYLSPNRNAINYYYTIPGIYSICFYTRSRILKRLTIKVFSKDWQGGYFPNIEPEMYKPFKDQRIFRQTDSFYAPLNDLLQEEKNFRKWDWTSYRYFSPFGKSLDSLTLETRVMNNASLGSLLCYNIKITLIGDSGIIDMTFAQLKCSRWAKLILSEKTLEGEFDELQALTVDMSDWLLIKTTTSNRQFSITIGDSVIFSDKYSKPLGNLNGIVYSFFGTGKIDFLELKDINGDIFYTNLFREIRDQGNTTP